MESKMRTIGLAMRETNHSIKRFVDFYISNNMSWHLTSGEGIVLGHIFAYKKNNPGKILTAKELVKTLSIRKPATSKFLKILEDKKFIETLENPRDKRIKEIVVTEKGKRVQEDFDKLWIEIEKQIENGFTDEEKQTLLKLLDKIRYNVKERRVGNEQFN